MVTRPDRDGEAVTPRTAARLAWAIALACFAMITAILVLLYLDRAAIDSSLAAQSLPSIVSALVLAVLGALVASRRPGNPIGWLLLGAGAALGVAALALFVAIHGLLAEATVHGWVRWLAWLQNLTPLLSAFLLIFVFLLFPNGKLRSRRWRWGAWTVVLVIVMLTTLSALDPSPLRLSPRLPPVQSPTAIRAIRGFQSGTSSLGLLWFTLTIPLALAIASLVLRLRGARGEERQQLKWVVYAMSASMVLTAVSVVVITTEQVTGASQIVGGVGLFIGFNLGIGLVVPGAVGLAILRYRLYDIDRIINRTLVYGGLTLLLGGLYAGLAVGLGSIAGSQNSLVIAGSTLVAAALFRPARRRIQGFIDRRFYRRKYDAIRTLERFGTRMRDEVDLDELRGHLVGVVKETMQPAHVSLWLRGQADGETALLPLP
ncbi:MAG: hypothetical protein M3Q23_13535 [Actinomycetota bacterium]|nr:hypothetical protein [Actinomycetota bacterium]